MQRHVSAASLALVIVFLLSACDMQAPFLQSATPTPPPIPTVPPRPHPSPVATLLDPPPTDCPTGQPPKSLPIKDQFGLQGTGKLQGNPPVWIVDPFYPPSPLHLEAGGYTAWPQWKIVWEVGPDYTQAVRLQIRNLRTGELAWWGADPDAWVGKTFVMDPEQPDINGPYWYHGHHFNYPAPVAGTWNEWGSVFLITEAGCYDLQVTWPGGQWDMFFAAGR